MNYKYVCLLSFVAIVGFLNSNAFAQSAKDYPVQGIPFNKVSIGDSFWLPKIETNRTVTIPASFRKCEETGRVQNFILAAKKEGKFLTTFPFDDTDIYKTIEGASFSMTVHPDPALDRYVDSLIAIVAKAQEPDGYLYTARTIDPQHPHSWSGKDRWVNESILSHELYNSGHLFEAAAAHYLATGKRNFLKIALKNADLLVNTFGPGKRNDAPGHEIVEMGLVRLYRITKEQKYLDLAKFFIDCRGKVVDPKKAYTQDHKPLVQQDEAVGHAVRAGYLYSGVADVAALTGDKAYIDAIDKIWENMVSKKFYITGGIGARHDGEAFGSNYELPNLTAYNETCAAIANVYWNYRMFLLHGDAKYIDVMERSLYNNVISGVGMDGKTFFYPNPLSCDMHYNFNADNTITRQPWFDCSCCPTNLCRFIASVPGYIYAQKESNLFVNLFITSKTSLQLQSKNAVEIAQKTNYPWDGTVSIAVNPARKSLFTLNLRIPGWAQNKPVPSDLYSYANPSAETISIKINGKAATYTMENGYARLSREWKKGDVVEYELPMTIHRVEANRNVKADEGKVALERGPIVYCLEGVDNPGSYDRFVLPDDAKLSFVTDDNKLNGTHELTGDGIQFNVSKDGLSIQSKKQPFTAIPYYQWCNRGKSAMEVWIPRRADKFSLSEQ
jgi:DUF1680 family protein